MPSGKRRNVEGEWGGVGWEEWGLVANQLQKTLTERLYELFRENSQVP